MFNIQPRNSGFAKKFLASGITPTYYKDSQNLITTPADPNCFKNSRTKEPANPYALAARRTMMQTALKMHNVKLRPQEKELIAFELRLFDLHFLIALLPVCSIPTQNVSIQMETTR